MRYMIKRWAPSESQAFHSSFGLQQSWMISEGTMMDPAGVTGEGVAVGVRKILGRVQATMTTAPALAGS